MKASVEIAGNARDTACVGGYHDGPYTPIRCLVDLWSRFRGIKLELKAVVHYKLVRSAVPAIDVLVVGYPRVQISKCIAHSAETGRHTVIGGDGLRRGVAHSRGCNLNAEEVTFAATHPKISVGILGQRVRDINGIGQSALVDPLTAIPPHGTNAVAVADEHAIRGLARLDSQIRRAVESVNGRQ